MNTLNKLPFLSFVNGASRLIVGGRPVLLLGGELHNSSSSNLNYMEREVWWRIAAIGCNMVLPAISWELLEPEEGQFDFSLIDGIVKQARERNVYLVPLWFGAYKNAQSNYAPAWVKQDLKRFVRAEAKAGVRTEAVSVLSKQLLDTDSRAFAALMRRIRQIDPDGRTVLMMQVENEVGLLRGSRDLCDQAQTAYEADVPKELTGYLATHELQPRVHSLWEEHGALGQGSWADLFGDGPDGDEVFMAWHFASYVGAVADAGLAEHPIPMYANAWLVQNDIQKAGEYPSGGPVAHMIDVWRSAAPNLAFLAPDIYLPNFAAECRRYTVSSNALFIPEMVRDLSAAANAFYAIGEYAAIGVAPFGIDGIDVGGISDVAADPSSLGNPVAPTVAGAHAPSAAGSHTVARLLRNSYRLLGDMAPLLQNVEATAVRGFLEDATVPEAPYMAIEMGEYRILIEWTNVWKAHESRQPPGDPFIRGGGLIVQTGSSEFIIAGFGFRARFECIDAPDRVLEFLAIDEGDFLAGQWVPGRRLNGDEYRIDLSLGTAGLPQIRRIAPYSYPVAPG